MSVAVCTGHYLLFQCVDVSFTTSACLLPLLFSLLTIRDHLLMLRFNFAVNVLDWKNVLVAVIKKCVQDSTNDM